ncbi:Hsp70 family protein [Solimonas sp. K1W22B-7]|nr:Hsp70 family protein [Solimonas sp. K1W22B-7]
MKPYAGIDFGTSNSAVCLGGAGPLGLVALEQDRPTLPSAVFYNADEQTTVFGRQAVAEYQAGYSGRLLRSLKSLLGSELLGETTLVNGRSVAYREIISGFMAHLKRRAEEQAGGAVERVVLGRPVHFVDDDATRDRAAENSMREIAGEIGFREVCFQYEPIAAAFDYETGLDREVLALVVDIGGGTSDFSLVRLGPDRAGKLDRSADVLASDGVHIAGTDFDQQLSLVSVMPCLGLNSPGREGKPVPSHIYFELATWHRINFLYTPRALSNAETLRPFYKTPNFHNRLMKVLRDREGHRLAGLVEDAKVAVADGGRNRMDLAFVEKGLMTTVNQETLAFAIDDALRRIVDTALETVKRANVTAAEVDTVYITGGSTGIRVLREAIAAAFPGSEQVIGDPFASVARGLGVYAGRVYG